MGGFHYRLQLTNGEHACTFQSAVQDWREGDEVLVASGARYRIVRIEVDDEDEDGLFSADWVVEQLRPPTDRAAGTC